MDGVGPGPARHPDDLVHVQIGVHRVLTLADQIALVRLEAVEGEAVLVGIDRDGAEAQLRRRAEDPDGDLAPVRDQKFLESRCAGRLRVCRRHDSRPPNPLASLIAAQTAQ
jgi:hypothetical protein